MNTAPVLESSELDFQDLLEQIRAMGYKIVDQFVEAIAPKFKNTRKLSIQELSKAFQEQKLQFFGQMLQGFIQLLHQDSLNQEYAACPECGKKNKKRRMASREIETRHGQSLIERPYFYCPKCKIGYCPVDKDLELSPGKKQADLQDLALEFIAEMPFDRASELFFKATGISYSEDPMHKKFEDFGQWLSLKNVVPSFKEIERRVEDLITGSSWKPVLMVASDGAHAPLRPPGPHVSG